MDYSTNIDDYALGILPPYPVLLSYPAVADTSWLDLDPLLLPSSMQPLVFFYPDGDSAPWHAANPLPSPLAVPLPLFRPGTPESMIEDEPEVKLEDSDTIEIVQSPLPSPTLPTRTPSPIARHKIRVAALRAKKLKYTKSWAVSYYSSVLIAYQGAGSGRGSLAQQSSNGASIRRKALVKRAKFLNRQWRKLLESEATRDREMATVAAGPIVREFIFLTRILIR
jgi:hypothetical protein